MMQKYIIFNKKKKIPTKDLFKKLTFLKKLQKLLM